MIFERTILCDRTISSNVLKILSIVDPVIWLEDVFF